MQLTCSVLDVEERAVLSLSGTVAHDRALRVPDEGAGTVFPVVRFQGALEHKNAVGVVVNMFRLIIAFRIDRQVDGQTCFPVQNQLHVQKISV